MYFNKYHKDVPKIVKNESTKLVLDFSYYSAVLELLKGDIYVEHSKSWEIFPTRVGVWGFTWEMFINGGGVV